MTRSEQISVLAILVSLIVFVMAVLWVVCETERRERKNEGLTEWEGWGKLEP